MPPGATTSDGAGPHANKPSVPSDGRRRGRVPGCALGVLRCADSSVRACRPRLGVRMLAFVMRETSLNPMPGPGNEYVDSVCRMTSDSSAARGIEVHLLETRQLHVVFAVDWLSSTAKAGAIGNVSHGDLRQVMDDGLRGYMFGPRADPWWRVFGRRRRRVSKAATDAMVIAVVAVRAWCGQIGMWVPTMSALEVTSLRWRSGAEVRGGGGDGLWHATVAGAGLGAEVVVAPHGARHQSVPVSVWVTGGRRSMAGSRTDAEA
jgi:hypothetical protein